MGVLDEFRLDGKTAVVTGCRRGIGRAVSVALAEAGADIIGISTSASPDDEVAAEVRRSGRSYSAIRADLSNATGIELALAEITALDKPVDILVNNAGAIRRAPAVSHGDADWAHVLSLNLTAPFVLSRAIGASMLERGSGRIVFLASLLSFQGGLNVASYAASKGGVVQLTKALANEWAAGGVNVNAVAPGYIATDVNVALREDEARRDAITSRIPAGTWGTPSDVAPAIVFLCSPAARYIHGAVLTVDGGWMGR